MSDPEASALAMCSKPSFTCRDDQYDRHRGCRSIFTLPAPFSEVLDSEYDIIMHLYQLAMNFAGRNVCRP
jgi:hypothetical protein